MESLVDRAKEAADIARQIEDTAKRDEAIREVVKSVGRLHYEDEA